MFNCVLATSIHSFKWLEITWICKSAAYRKFTDFRLFSLPETQVCLKQHKYAVGDISTLGVTVRIKLCIIYYIIMNEFCLAKAIHSFKWLKIYVNCEI